MRSDGRMQIGGFFTVTRGDPIVGSPSVTTDENDVVHLFYRKASDGCFYHGWLEPGY